MPQLITHHPHAHHTPLVTHLNQPLPRCSVVAKRLTPAIYLPKAAGTLRKPQKITTFTSTNKSSSSIVRCMANQRRVKMVAKQIRRELSAMLLTDNVLQFAVLPEAALGADRYLSSLTTISDVEVSSDLQVIFHL